MEEGMDQEDVPVAFQRDTPPVKLKAQRILCHSNIGVGEALPSISQVSKMTLQTRTSHSLHGTKVICEGGKIKSLSEIGCPVGTEVEVKNLFYNIPVKRKFLKTIRSELRYALNHFLRLSLSHPTISFKLIHDGRTLQTPQNRIALGSNRSHFREGDSLAISSPLDSMRERSESRDLPVSHPFRKEMQRASISMSINALSRTG